MRSGLLIMLVGAACGSSSLPKGDACKAAATDVGTFLTKMDHEVEPVSLEHVSPAERADLKLHESTVRMAPVIEVRADDIFYQDQRASGPVLDTRLADAHARIHEDIVAGRFARHDPPDPDALIVVADAHARWSMVVTGLQSAHHAGFDHVTLVFRRPSATPPPPHTKVDDEIAKLMKDTEGGSKATAFASYTQPKVAPCPALVRVFGEVGGSEVEDRAGYLLSRVGPALIECDCAVDPAEIRSLMWNLAGNPHPIGVIQVTLDPQGTPLVAKADAPWSEASKQLAVDATKVWFAIK